MSHRKSYTLLKGTDLEQTLKSIIHCVSQCCGGKQCRDEERGCQKRKNEKGGKVTELTEVRESLLAIQIEGAANPKAGAPLVCQKAPGGLCGESRRRHGKDSKQLKGFSFYLCKRGAIGEAVIATAGSHTFQWPVSGFCGVQSRRRRGA